MTLKRVSDLLNLYDDLLEELHILRTTRPFDLTDEEYDEYDVRINMIQDRINVLEDLDVSI